MAYPQINNFGFQFSSKLLFLPSDFAGDIFHSTQLIHIVPLIQRPSSSLSTRLRPFGLFQFIITFFLDVWINDIW